MALAERYIKSRIRRTHYSKLGVKTSVCTITLDNGFEVIGTSSCINPADYDAKMGAESSYENAFEKLWELFGFVQHEIEYMNQAVKNEQ